MGLPPPVVPHEFSVNIHFTDPSPGEMAGFAEAGYRCVAWISAGGASSAAGVYDFLGVDRLVARLARSTPSRS